MPLCTHTRKWGTVVSLTLLLCVMFFDFFDEILRHLVDQLAALVEIQRPKLALLRRSGSARIQLVNQILGHGDSQK